MTDQIFAPLVILLLAGCGAAPTAVATPRPESADGATAARPSHAWVNDSPFSGQAPRQGAVDYVALADGSFVVTLSFASDAEPFVLLTGKKGALSKSKPPWSCAGGPAEIEASGAALWVHCMGLEDQPHIHFWYSGDTGKTWTRVGALDGAIALGSYAFAGDRMYVTGELEGQATRLHVMSRLPDGGFSRRSAQGKLGWPDDVKATVAAAPDGSAIVLLGVNKAGELLIAASTDGGASVRSIWRGPWETTSPPLGASIDNGVLTFPVERGSGLFGIARMSLADAKPPVVSRFGSEAEDVCVHGLHAMAQFKEGAWATSSDAGATFSSIPAPQHEEMAVLECSPSGARYGFQFLAW